MERYVADGRSTPGTPQKNAVAVDFHHGESVMSPMPKKQAKAKKK